MQFQSHSSAKHDVGTERVFNARVVLSTWLYPFFFAYFQAWVCLLKCCSNKCFNCFMSYVDNDLEVIKAWGRVGAAAVWELTGHQEVTEQPSREQGAG